MHIAKRVDDRIWYRGYGADQYVYYAQKGEKKFLGGTFAVENYEDLERWVLSDHCSTLLVNCGYIRSQKSIRLVVRI